MSNISEGFLVLFNTLGKNCAVVSSKNKQKKLKKKMVYALIPFSTRNMLYMVLHKKVHLQRTQKLFVPAKTSHGNMVPQITQQRMY